MFLAFQIGDIIRVPFGWLLGVLYELTHNYGIAMILFAVIVQLVLLPINAKSKKSMMKLSRIQPRIQEIQRRYENDQQRQQEAIQKLQQEEGVSMGFGGCLWSLVPMLILFPLFTVIREPITYILGQGAEVSAEIIRVVKELAPDLFSGNSYYDQVVAASAISTYAPQIAAAIPGISAETLAGINFDFLGINLGAIPDWKIWAWSAFNWANIGAFLIPVISTGSQFLQMWVNQKTNDSLITNEKGVQDKEVAENSQTAQQNKMMMWMMPLMTLWIGFTVSTGLSLYWLIGGFVRMISDPIMTKHYRKIYDAEDAERLKRAMELDAIEAEKERVRAERRAANPEGQTQNTSKKKLQKKQQLEEEAAKAAAAREYAAKRGIPAEEAEAESTCMSGIPSRPYCKGRNYDPNRYATESTEE